MTLSKALESETYEVVGDNVELVSCVSALLSDFVTLSETSIEALSESLVKASR